MPGFAADGSNEIHERLAAGGRTAKNELDFVTAELAKDQNNEFKRLVAGEVLASQGFYGLAAEQFAAADKLKPDYVLGQFKALFAENRFLPALYFTYLQEKYPEDPALLFYAARRNLSALSYSREANEQAMATARKELNMAIKLKNPYPGTFATLAMMDYNQGKIDSAMELIEKELKLNPDQPMALRVRALALTRQGKRPSDILPEIKAALRVAPMDPEMNLLMGRACLFTKNYKEALRPALLGLFWQHDPLTLGESKAQVYELLSTVPRQELLDEINRISLELSDPETHGRGFRSTLLRMRLAELFAIHDEKEEALKQLETALRMHPHFRAAVAFRIGQVLVSMHRYFEAFPYLEMACHLNQSQTDADKYNRFRTRIARVGLNSQRDLALKIKMMFSKDQ